MSELQSSLLLTRSDTGQEQVDILKKSLLLLGREDENAEQIELRKSLLITHGTIYGVLNEAMEVVQWTEVNSSIAGAWAARTKPAYAPSIIMQDDPLSGTITDNTPIDVVSWTGVGTTPQNHLWPWQDCLTLLTRI